MLSKSLRRYYTRQSPPPTYYVGACFEVHVLRRIIHLGGDAVNMRNEYEIRFQDNFGTIIIVNKIIIIIYGTFSLDIEYILGVIITQKIPVLIITSKVKFTGTRYESGTNRVKIPPVSWLRL